MRRRSTPRLVSAVSVSFIGIGLAVIAGVPEAALLAAPWFVLLVLGLSRTASSADPVVDVQVDVDRVMVGDVVSVVTHVTLPVDGTVRVNQGLENTVDVVRAGEPLTIESERIAEEWGVHPLVRTTLHVREQYGLFESAGAAVDAGTVQVHPSSVELRQLLTPWMVRRVSGTHPSRASARGVEFADIRPFGAGDSVRDINWWASARSADLLVSDRHPDRATDVILLVDSFVESGHNVRQIFGMTIEAALSLAESHLGATDRVGLIEFGGLVRWVSPGVGRHQLQRLTDAVLATGLYSNAADRDFPVLPPKALPPRSFIVALSPLLDERFVEAIFEARSRGHDVAVIECLGDDSAVQLVAGMPDGDTDPSLRSVAIRLWQAEQQVIRDQMAERGISVATWRNGEHLDLVINALVRRRQRVARVAGR